MRNFQKIVELKLLGRKMSIFFKTYFWSNLWKIKDWESQKGIIWLFWRKKVKFPQIWAKMTWINSKQKKQEIASIPRNFWILWLNIQNKTVSHKKSSQFWSKLAFQKENREKYRRLLNKIIILVFWEAKFMRIIFWIIFVFWRVFETFSVILPFSESFHFQKVKNSQFCVL